jgi:hypothetical protein
MTKRKMFLKKLFFRNIFTSVNLVWLGVVTHVDQTWNSVLEGLEQIDAVFDELMLDGEQ